MLSVLFTIALVMLARATILNLRKGIQLYILLMPFIQPYMIISLGGLNLSLQLASTLLMSGFIVFNYAFHPPTTTLLNQNTLNRPTVILAILLLFTVLGNIPILGTNFLNYVMFLCRKLLLIFMGWLSFRSLEDGKELAKKLTALFAILLLYGVLEFLTKGNAVLSYFQSLSKDANGNIMIYDAGLRGYRLQSIFYHSYSWGGVLLLISPLFLFMALRARKRQSLYYWTIYLLTLFNVVFTHSRSVIVPALLMASLFLLIRSDARGRARKREYFVPIFLFGLIAVLFSPKVLQAILPYFSISESNTGLKGSTSEMRVDQYLAALAYLKNTFLTGNGFDFSKNLLKAVGTSTDLEGIESQWYVILLDNGLIGVIGYVIFYAGIIRRFYRQRRLVNTQAKTHINYIVITIIGYIIFVSLTGEMSTFPFFMIGLGMAARLIYIERENWQKEKILNANTATLQSNK